MFQISHAHTAALVFLACLLSAALGAAGFAYAQGARGFCQVEDAPACVWVGPVQGNGNGSIVVNGPAR